MKITFARRVTISGCLILFFLLIYGVARSYSYDIVAYVVEQALFQKAPAGVSAEQLRERLKTALGSVRTESKLFKLMAISSYLEKVQKLTTTELDRLLAHGGPGAGALY